jgi:hypothetical protein
MINYKIIVSSGQNKPVNKPVKVDHTAPNFKQVVFERSLRGCNYKQGSRVKLRGTNRKGTVLEVIADIESINWTKNKPHYIAVHFDDGQYGLCNPGQLRGTKA